MEAAPPLSIYLYSQEAFSKRGDTLLASPTFGFNMSLHKNENKQIEVRAIALLLFICLIGTWFGVEGLMSAGEPCESPIITKAVDRLLT